MEGSSLLGLSCSSSSPRINGTVMCSLLTTLPLQIGSLNEAGFLFFEMKTNKEDNITVLLILHFPFVHYVQIFYTILIRNLQDEPAGRILELCILHLAMSEITVLETRHPVVINEAVDLAKRFCDGSAPRIINGCLRTFVKQIEEAGCLTPALGYKQKVVTR
ncbi:hypothetical protein DVH24_037987 [Malus domestica]|uniref:NusB/RsmB/TIM44 domain-containing protein n=1 Tax=Malus domestica TaxID=3750 RepID=A0A498KE20_MALDO|nr:hypothetical protein DVH24_037987 [Malus domestica]